MAPAVQAALIAAAVTVVGVLLRDLALAWTKSRSDRRTSDRTIYRSYAKPLGDAASSLLWRLTEVLNPQRGADFLIDPSTRYERYKLLSSYYRLAALLGWIRAFRRELQFLPAHRKDHIASLRAALDRIEKALADGTDVELQRADEIIQLWRLDIAKDQHVRFCVEIDQIFERTIQKYRVHRPLDLDARSQETLAQDMTLVARRFCRKGSPTDVIVRETLGQLIDRISIRESWIYRDWQAGIGDFMITPAPQGTGRAYDVIGFAEFEARTSSADEETVRWVGRIAGVFDGLDVKAPESVDARLQQVRNMHHATAGLLVTLSDAERVHASQIGEATLQEARRIVGPKAQGGRWRWSLAGAAPWYRRRDQPT